MGMECWRPDLAWCVPAGRRWWCWRSDLAWDGAAGVGSGWGWRSCWRGGVDGDGGDGGPCWGIVGGTGIEVDDTFRFRKGNDVRRFLKRRE
jgi:hypothetical protein